MKKSLCMSVWMACVLSWPIVATGDDERDVGSGPTIPGEGPLPGGPGSLNPKPHPCAEPSCGGTVPTIDPETGGDVAPPWRRKPPDARSDHLANLIWKIGDWWVVCNEKIWGYILEFVQENSATACKAAIIDTKSWTYDEKGHVIKQNHSVNGFQFGANCQNLSE